MATPPELRPRAAHLPRRHTLVRLGGALFGSALLGLRPVLAQTTAPAAVPATATAPAPAAALTAASSPSSTAATTRTLPLAEAIARHSDAASRFVEVDGVRVHYKDEGVGPVVLLVHGTFGDLGDWDGWLPVLKPELRVVRLDLPGFGLTGPVASGNYSVDRLLSLVDGFMDALQVERFAIVGVSFGGLVAFRYAATRTERISALLLANSAGIQFGQRAAASTGTNILTDPRVGEADVRRFLEFMLNDPALITPAMVQRKLAFTNIAGRGDEASAALRLYERGSPERVLAHVRAPSLVMWGAANQALSTQTADAFVAALRRAAVRERVLYPEGGHMLHVQRPRQTAQDALAFLLTHLKRPT